MVRRILVSDISRARLPVLGLGVVGTTWAWLRVPAQEARAVGKSRLNTAGWSPGHTDLRLVPGTSPLSESKFTSLSIFSYYSILCPLIY